MVGRKPKPTKLKLLTGHGHHPLNKNEPEAPEGELHCPAHLSAEAKKEWHRIVPILYQMKIARIPDQAAIAAYCQTYGRWAQAEKQLKTAQFTVETKKGNVLQNPIVGIANRAMEIMLKFMTEFGLTPSSRSRIVSDKPAQAENEFMARRKKIG